MTGVRVHTFAAMGTTVSFRAPGHAVARVGHEVVEEVFSTATEWFGSVESICNRFDPDSELSRLSGRVGVPTVVSSLLFRTVEFALALAELTGGAFDPTIGKRMESLGFDRSYRTGEQIRSPVSSAESVSYRDVHIDPARSEITLTRPLLLDLGAVAKGLAIDLAARALQPLGSFVIDAGGDLWLEGFDDDDAPWTVGIRDPRGGSTPIESFEVTGAAVCTSGDYERRNSEGRAHIVDPRAPDAPIRVTSATVMSSSAMVADALSTAAAVLGPELGIPLLEQEGADGIIYTSDLRRFATSGRFYPASLTGESKSVVLSSL